MAVNNSYGMVLARSVDILFCSWFWRDYDITISSMAGLELRKARGANSKRWLVLLGKALNRIQAGHCESAIIADILRCTTATAILTGATPP